MDCLQILPMENWPCLRDSLKKDWPTYAYYYNWVNNAMKWRKKDPQLAHEIYCPQGKHESGVFIGMSLHSLYIVVIFAFDDSKDLLRKTLLETKIIDWNTDILFGAVHQYFKPTLLNALNELKKMGKVAAYGTDTTIYHFKPKVECAEMKFQVPDECYMKHLDITDIPLVHSVWPHRSIKYPELSTKFLGAMVKYNRGVGLYLKQDNSLVSWILHSDWGGLGMLQTVEQHKRKGYGKIVLQALIKELALEENLDSVLFIVDENLPSMKLFESLGYQRLTTATWTFVTPPEN